MAVEIRPARAEEIEEFKRVAGHALVMDPATFVGMEPEFTLCAFEDGKLATSYAAWPLTMRFNGVGLPVAAVTTVGTFPIYRRRGNLRKIMTADFARLHEAGERPIAILYASMAAIYQRYGYAVVSTHNAYNIDPRYLRFAIPTDVSGSYRELGDDDFPLLVNLYRRFREETTGFLHRGRAMWQAGALAPAPSGGILHRIAYEEAGETLGYVIYTIQPGHERLPSHQIAIRDLAWLTPSAYQAIWDYFAKMDLVSSIVWGRVPQDDPLPHLLLEPKMLGTTSTDGLLGRVVDVERAMPGRGYDVAGVLTFEVMDELCPWNAGGWRLEASPDGASVARHSGEAQLAMPVSTLAMLMFDQVRASEAARMGRLQVNDPSALPVWDSVMRTRYRPACTDMF
jgi:predicted acetyltransferase